MVYKWLKKILFPECHCCRKPITPDRYLCATCQQKMPVTPYACKVCAAALPDDTQSLCGACIKQMPDFDASIAAYRFDQPVAGWIKAFKFSRQLQHVPVLADALLQAVQGQGMPDLLLPIPLHRTRLRERGFNQSLELARYLSRHLSVAVDAHSLCRQRETKPQSGLKARQRQRNVREAFQVVKPIAAKHVALIDDVMTSGATVSEAAYVLKQAGVERVDVWVVARAQRNK